VDTPTAVGGEPHPALTCWRTLAAGAGRARFASCWSEPPPRSTARPRPPMRSHRRSTLADMAAQPWTPPSAGADHACATTSLCSSAGLTSRLNCVKRDRGADDARARHARGHKDTPEVRSWPRSVPSARTSTLPSSRGRVAPSTRAVNRTSV